MVLYASDASEEQQVQSQPEAEDPEIALYGKHHPGG
jgi:hypothetical protein